MDQILRRLERLFDSWLHEADNDSHKSTAWPFGQSQSHNYGDPDLADAWEELNDYLRDGDTDSAGDRNQGSSYSGYQRSGTSGDLELHQAFEALGLSYGTPYETVRLQYKKLLMQHHPDRHAHDPEALKKATEKAQKLNQAFQRIKKHYGKT